MTETAYRAETAAGAPGARPRARTALLKRLADVVSLPSSRVNAFERAVTADLLVEILREAELEDRMRVARRLATLTEIPSILVRLILRDTVEVAAPLLVENTSLGECDLLDCVRLASEAHRRAIAGRRHLGEPVCEALALTGELSVIEALLRNDGAKLSYLAIETLVAMSRRSPQIVAPLLRRGELRPSHAYVLFWWADPPSRRIILQRFAVSREVLQDTVADVFPMAAEEDWADPLARKALQFIERRQRNRAAIERSAFGSLEEAIASAEKGMTSETLREIAYLSGLKPMTAAKIMADMGGEPVAILCKATGLPKSALASLWRAMKRTDVDAQGDMAPLFERVVATFDMIAVDRAQTVLRYWNWSLSSAMTPALVEAIRAGDEGAVDEFSAPARAAMLAFSADLAR
ncbi:MAG: DUF2336 domain-containing protein [Caulobacteraceae bacterium]